jgi:type IV pilus assembly protein PilC
MAFYRYEFTDARGQVLEGTVQADTLAEAEALLKLRGYASIRFHDPAKLPAKAPAPITPAPARSTTVRTRKGKDADRYFLFSQIAQQLKAGIAPAQAFTTLASVTHQEPYRIALQDLAQSATNGRPLSDTLDRYPDLFPPHVGGMIRAGETGGFLPDAFAELSNQAGEAHKFKRFHWFVWYLIPRALAVLPVLFAFREALILSYRRTSDGSPNAGLAAVLLEKLMWPYGPIALAVTALLLLLRWWMSSLPMRTFRHRMALQLPVYGARARNESVAIFSWTLSRLGKAGLPPHRMWPLAAAAVPNLEMSRRLVQTGRSLHDGSRLSEAIFNSGVFPQQYAPLISTGEMIGDVPGALDRLEVVSRGDYDESTGRARFTSTRLGCAFAMLVSGIVLIVLMRTWYGDLYNEVLKDFTID